MIPYEELAAALEGQPSAPPSIASAESHDYEADAPLHEDPTLNGREPAGPELELGDVLSDEEAS